MNKIQQMVHDLCPNGVEWKTLGEVGIFYGGLSGKSKKDFENGNAKFITYKNVYANPSLSIDVADRVTMLPNERQNKVMYGDILFTGSSETPDECAMSSVLTTHTDEELYLNSFCFGFRFASLEGINPDFYKHYFRCENVRKTLNKTAHGTTRYNVSKKEFAQIPIPIPPLSIQAEIVNLLDKFTQLLADLKTELKLRKKQYDYYRNHLLSFDANSTTVQWMPLDEVFELRNGYTPSKANPAFWEGGTIPWFRMEDIREHGRVLSDSIQHITPAAVKGKGLFEAGSFILATTATIGEHALLIADSLANQRFTNLKIRKSLKEKLQTGFVFHYMFVVDDFCKKHTNKSGFESVDMEALRNMPFPIPPIAEQERIVGILDKFETLVNDLSKGLPAEIALVQKQYEYYRNLLLTF